MELEQVGISRERIRKLFHPAAIFDDGPLKLILSPTFFTPIILLFQKQHGTNDSCVSCSCVQKSKMHKEAAFF